jgi:hypothetical protein
VTRDWATSVAVITGADHRRELARAFAATLRGAARGVRGG